MSRSFIVIGSVPAERRRRAPHSQSGPNHYLVREEAVRKLGMASYGEYLDSELWRQIRARILVRSGGNCEVCCRAKAYTAHHVSYSVPVLLGQADRQLLAICRRCHYCVEFDSQRKRRSGIAIAAALETLIRKFRGGKAAKRNRRRSNPACRCCRKSVKNSLGRNGICLKCYKEFGPKVHDIANRKDSGAIVRAGMQRPK